MNRSFQLIALESEHFAPLFVTLGAVVESGVDTENAVEGFWFGLSKRSVQFS